MRSADRGGIMKLATRGPGDAASRLPGSGPTDLPGPGASCRIVRPSQRSLFEIDESLGESGYRDSNPMGSFSDSRTQRTLLERLAQSGGQNQAAWSEFVARYGR